MSFCPVCHMNPCQPAMHKKTAVATPRPPQVQQVVQTVVQPPKPLGFLGKFYGQPAKQQRQEKTTQQASGFQRQQKETRQQQAPNNGRKAWGNYGLVFWMVGEVMYAWPMRLFKSDPGKTIEHLKDPRTQHVDVYDFDGTSVRTHLEDPEFIYNDRTKASLFERLNKLRASEKESKPKEKVSLRYRSMQKATTKQSKFAGKRRW